MSTAEGSTRQRGHKGAKFTIHLPLIREIGERPSPSEAPARKPHTEKAVLVVEDEESLPNLIAEILDQDGYRVDRCGDGQQAINKMKLMRYDAVITDTEDARDRGIELYTFIQKHYPKLAPRVLFITGDVELVQEGDRQRRHRRGRKIDGIRTASSPKGPIAGLSIDGNRRKGQDKTRPRSFN